MLESDQKTDDMEFSFNDLSILIESIRCNAPKFSAITGVPAQTHLANPLPMYTFYWVINTFVYTEMCHFDNMFSVLVETIVRVAIA